MSPALARFQAAGAELGFRLGGDSLKQFDRYQREILSWRRRLNLTSTTAADVLGLHFVDSLLALSVCDFPRGCLVADVGSGAGLPGIALKLVRPDLRMTLVEASRRRVAFLEHVRSTLELSDVEIAWTRAEVFGRSADAREGYDRTVERATARIAVAVELCLPLVRPGGAAVFLKGPSVARELDKAVALSEALGGRIVRSEVRPLPTTDRSRTVIVIGKVRSTPLAFPRSTRHLGRPPQA